MAPEKHVTVGIIGGGIAGLTLARILEQAGVSYLLWEAHNHIAPPTGASIGLMPNGLRILDQMGIIEDVEKHSYPHHSWEMRDGDGALYCSLTGMKLYPKIFGYEGMFMERQQFLRLLYHSIEDKTRIQTSRRLCSLQSLDDHVVITAADGTSISCDVVAGADGVRSVIRREIEATLPSIEKTPHNFASRYSCVFGISEALHQIQPGRLFTIYRKDVSLLITSGQSGTVYWFLFEDLKTTIELGQPKKFSDDDVQAVYAKVADTKVTEGVKFSDIFRNKRTAVKTLLEEGLADRFQSGRMFLLGDSAHKTLPHGAMGANQAIESAACFMNYFLQLCREPDGSFPVKIPTSVIKNCLKMYEEKRRSRVAEIIEQTNFSCRTQLKTSKDTEEYVLRLPKMTDKDLLVRGVASLSKAEKIENWGCGSERVAFYSNAVSNCWNI